MEGLNTAFEGHCNDLSQKLVTVRQSDRGPCSTSQALSLQSLPLYNVQVSGIKGTAMAQGPGELLPGILSSLCPSSPLLASVPLSLRLLPVKHIHRRDARK